MTRGLIMNMLDKMIDFEEGNLNMGEIIELFSELVKTGQAWTLQGTYGRTAQSLIIAGYLDEKGNINANMLLEDDDDEND